MKISILNLLQYVELFQELNNVRQWNGYIGFANQTAPAACGHKPPAPATFIGSTQPTPQQTSDLGFGTGRIRQKHACEPLAGNL
jgi:hypothetical protein